MNNKAIKDFFFLLDDEDLPYPKIQCLGGGG
jgi:hypothetical protein